MVNMGFFLFIMPLEMTFPLSWNYSLYYNVIDNCFTLVLYSTKNIIYIHIKYFQYILCKYIEYICILNQIFVNILITTFLNGE